ncbi:MAG: sensor domain-containing protein [Mycobacterium sp.]|nr:sensor domain-containing protein [Mycobacterium sp.]
MRMCGSATTLLVVAALTVGCGAVIDGTAKPAPNLKRRPLTGNSVRQVPLDNVALSRMLSQPFVTRMPPEFGGPGKLYSQIPPASCLGVTAMLQKSVYDSAEIKDVASESWWNNGDPAQVISVMEGVVTLPTAAQAQALFAKFSKQWQECNGTTTTEQDGPISTTNVISDIRVADAAKTIVAATNTATSVLPNMPALLPTPQARAIGVELNCLVEVQVVFFGDRRPSDPGTATLDTSGVEIARAMMDRVSALS